MERIDFINTDRIQWCCNDVGISVDDLAQEAGISQASLLKTLSGEPKSGLTFIQLKKVANYFGRGIFFFLEEGDIPEEKVHSVEFRSLSNQKPNLSLKLRKLIERVEFQRDRYLSLIEDLGLESNDLFSPPMLDTSIQIASNQVREWLNLGDRNNFDSYRHAIENQGVLVFQSNGYKGEWQIPKESPILGFSLYQENCPVIVVKKQDHPARQVFTLMHELGHLLLHKESSIDDDADYNAIRGHEYEANCFAGLVLVPDHFLERIDIDAKPESAANYTEWLKPHRKLWGVSTEVILRRLKDNAVINSDDYAAYRQWLQTQKRTTKDGGNRGYRHREPKHIFGDKYVRTVFDAKNAHQITLAKMSSYLDNLQIKDLHQLEQHLASY